MENIKEQVTVEEEVTIEEEAVGQDFETEKKSNRFKETVTNKNVQIGAAASSITGIIGFLLGQVHEQRTQNKLLERAREIVQKTQQLTLQMIESEELQKDMVKDINYVLSEEEEGIVELKKVEGDLQSATDLALDEIERLQSSKFNIIAKRRAKSWIKLQEDLVALIMTLVVVIKVKEEAVEQAIGTAFKQTQGKN